MTDTFIAAFNSVSGARAYDTVLVPRLFTPCAIMLLVRLGLQPGETLLDVACGTGAVSRLAAPILGPTGHIHGRDLTEAMLDIARAHPPQPGAAKIDWAIAAADSLDLADQAVDVVTCQQGLQFFPDPAAAVREMYRVLRPDGRVGIAVWRGIEECPLWAAVQVALRRHLDDERADALGAPFSWPGEDALVAVLDAAGFRDIVVSTHQVVMAFEGGMAQAAPSLAATPIGRDLAALDPGQRARFLSDATAALGRSESPADPIEVPAATLLATGRR